ncbi:MAG: hypothetical protein WEB60_00985, partial [Terrimicrobiaceae bacterium]
VALAESAISGDGVLGASIRIPESAERADVTLFNESQSRVLISVSAKNAGAVEALLSWRGIGVLRLGSVTHEPTLEIVLPDQTVTWSANNLKSSWGETIGDLMAGFSGH